MGCGATKAADGVEQWFNPGTPQKAVPSSRAARKGLKPKGRVLLSSAADRPQFQSPGPPQSRAPPAGSSESPPPAPALAADDEGTRLAVLKAVMADDVPALEQLATDQPDADLGVRSCNTRPKARPPPRMGCEPTD